MNTIKGDLSLHFEGYGFVVPSEAGHADVFIPARYIGNAMHGDTVEVSVRKSSKGLFEGKVEKVLKHNLTQLVGRLEVHGKSWTLVSEDQRVHHRMELKPVGKGFKQGDYVVARITEYPEGEKSLRGEILEKLPERGSLMAEIEYVIAKHQWPKKFPEPVLEEAKAIDDAARSGEERWDASERKDLRHLAFVTIDGEDAKDFDDAVYAEALPKGGFRLWVAIADVSHYVKPQKVIDREAYGRATSVYFPGRVLPMLPEALSNDLCSLRPNEDRMSMVAEIEFDNQGEVTRESFYPAIFQSHARLTYTLVRRMVVDREQKLREEMSDVIPMVETLSDVAHLLKERRNRRGSIDFDLPEPDIILNMTGGIENIERSSRNWSHQIIEELMIAANEAVARFLTARKVGCLYRIHDTPTPDKIKRFYKLVQRLGYKGPFPVPTNSKVLEKIIQFFDGHPEKRLVNTILLRSMAQAVYSPHNVGHFGLASDCYCHFTSPIRRYPDLIIHRLMRQALGFNKTKTPLPLLEEMGGHCSKQERKAMEAEREMEALHKALFMRDKLGEAFNGIISHVTKFGFFVELIDFFVEGLVPLQEIKGDFFVYDEEHLCLRGKKRKKIFKIGDRVRIVVKDVKLLERRIFFNLLDSN